MSQNVNHSCTYCEGHGYQDVISGTETCPACEGSGKEEE